MFEELIIQLDELGVPYTEETESLVIDIANIDKVALIDVIIYLNDAGYTFDINETTITVEGTAVPVEEETYDEEAYLDDAFAQM